MLPPEPEPRIHRVEIVHSHRSGINPQRIIVVAAFAVLLLIVRSPTAFIMLGVLIPPTFWIAAGIAIALLAIVAWREHRAGRPF